MKKELFFIIDSLFICLVESQQIHSAKTFK